MYRSIFKSLLDNGKKGRIMKLVMMILIMATSSFAANQAVITTTDFSSGSFSSIDLSTNVASNDHLTIHSDAVVRTYKDKVYVINRLGQDNVIVLDKSDLSKPLTQYSTGNGTNPQDIAFVSESKAYISRYGHQHLLVVNPVTGDSLGHVDLSAFADADGIPEMAQMTIYDNHLFVACQRLDQNNGFVPTDFSLIAVVDVTTDQVVDQDATIPANQGILMASANTSEAARWGTKWVLSNVKTFGSLTDGGLEVINLVTLKSEGVAIGELALGGNVNALAMGSGNKGYVVVSDANFANLVVGFDLATKVVSTNLSDLSGGYVPGLGVFDQRLYVLDRGSFSDPTSGGVKVFDVKTNQLIAGPINTGLPPLAIAFLGTESPLVGDFNGDGVVSFPDFLAFANAFGKQTGESGFDAKFDLNGNGRVDFPDFLKFVPEFNSATGG
jgi:hypothetical protein